MVDGLDAAKRRPYVCKFNTEPVFSTRCAFLCFIVIGGSAQMCENEFGNPYRMFRMFGNINAVAIIIYSNNSVASYGNFYIGNWYNV